MTYRTQILIVDDEPPNRLILEDLLERQYQVHALANGREAIDYLDAGGQADMILLDVVMPVMDGFEACRRIKAEPNTRDTPVLFLTSLESPADEEHGLSLGADDFIHKPFSPQIVLARVRNHLELSRARAQLRSRNLELESQVEAATRDLLRQNAMVIETQDATITALCTLAEVRDDETGNHIRRTQNYVRALAQELSGHPRFAAELGEDIIALLFKSAPLHDVGKVAIPDNILLKPGKLTPEEWVTMRRHTEYGRDAMAGAEKNVGEAAGFLRYAREIAYGHHERWDGSGYPQGLAGEDIPLPARIMAVADVYDALISKRVYKPAFEHEKAVEMIVEGKGKHFDPDVVVALLAIHEQFREIARRYSDDEQESQQ